MLYLDMIFYKIVRNIAEGIGRELETTYLHFCLEHEYLAYYKRCTHGNLCICS